MYVSCMIYDLGTKTYRWENLSGGPYRVTKIIRSEHRLVATASISSKENRMVYNITVVYKKKKETEKNKIIAQRIKPIKR